MKYHEVVTIRPECAECPWLTTLAGVYDIAQTTKDELSLEIIDGNVNQGLFALLLSEGYGVEEAEAFMAERADEIAALNIEALEELDENQATMVSLGEKLMNTCEPSGVYVDADDPQLKVCRSALAASVAATLHD